VALTNASEGLTDLLGGAPELRERLAPLLAVNDLVQQARPLLNAREHLVDALRRLREVRAGAFEVRDRVRQARGLFRVAEQLADVSLTALDRLEDATERADPLLEIVVQGRLGQRFRRALEIADDALDVARDDAEAAHHLRQVVARSRPDLRTRWQRRLVRAADADG